MPQLQVTIPQIPPAGYVSSSDKLEIDQGGASLSATIHQIAGAIGGNLVFTSMFSTLGEANDAAFIAKGMLFVNDNHTLNADFVFTVPVQFGGGNIARGPYNITFQEPMQAGPLLSVFGNQNVSSGSITFVAGQEVSPCWWGAVSDFVDWASVGSATDNSAAFQAAINSNAIVQIPAGYYYCATTLLLNAGRVLIGPRTVHFPFNESPDLIAKLWMESGQDGITCGPFSGYNNVIKNIAIEGRDQTTASTARGINFAATPSQSGGQYCEISGVQIRYFLEGITIGSDDGSGSPTAISKSYRVTLSDCRTYNCGTGIHLVGAAQSIVSNCSCLQTQAIWGSTISGNGVVQEGPGDVLYLNLDCEGNYTQFWLKNSSNTGSVANTSSATIIKPNFETSKYVTFRVSGTSSLVVKGGNTSVVAGGNATKYVLLVETPSYGIAQNEPGAVRIEDLAFHDFVWRDSGTPSLSSLTRLDCLAHVSIVRFKPMDGFPLVGRVVSSGGLWGPQEVSIIGPFAGINSTSGVLPTSGAANSVYYLNNGTIANIAQTNFGGPFYTPFPYGGGVACVNAHKSTTLFGIVNLQANQFNTVSTIELPATGLTTALQGVLHLTGQLNYNNGNALVVDAYFTYAWTAIGTYTITSAYGNSSTGVSNGGPASAPLVQCVAEGGSSNRIFVQIYASGAASDSFHGSVVNETTAAGQYPMTVAGI